VQFLAVARLYQRHNPPNIALEPTAYSFGFAYASGGGSPLAFGFNGRKKVGIRPMRENDDVV